MTTQVEVSRLNAYTVEVNADARVSRVNAYGVMVSTSVKIARLNTYAVLKSTVVINDVVLTDGLAFHDDFAEKAATAASGVGLHDVASLDFASTATTLTDGLRFAGVAELDYVDSIRVLGDGLKLGANLKTAMGYVLTSGVGISEAFDYQRFAGALVEEVCRFQSTLLVNQNREVTVAERLAIAQFMAIAIPAMVQDGLSLADSMTIVQAVTMLERLTLRPDQTPTLTYHMSLLSRIMLHDDLRQFLGAEIIEALELYPLAGVQLRSFQALADTLAIDDDALIPQLLMRVDLAEHLGLSPTQVLNAIYNGVFSDILNITAAYLEPGGAALTFAINTRTSSVSTYTNFDFNSFAPLGRRYIAGSADGLFVLDGDKDVSDPVIARIRTGFLQMNSVRLAGIKGIYLGLRGEGDYVLKVITGNNHEVWYAVKAHDGQTTKVKIGKGLEARYFAFELISKGGQDFDLDNIELVPMRRSRRV
jgi:hypothetical protein